jgi:ribonuclease G
MEAFGVEQEIRSTLSRRVDLPSGGYLIFDYAEAFTVIDVNTGRFVGSRSKKSGARLEDTITKNNLEAVKEVVRQLRLRDIGGIIVIDFIDMASPKNRAAVESALGEELERDRTKTYVVEISPLGLVEMTRQNVTDGPREVMTKKCPTCGGDGIVVSEHTAAVDVERRLRALVMPGSRDKAFKVEVEAKVAALVAGPGASRLLELEETTKRRFFLIGKEGEHLDHFRVLDQGTLEKVSPKLPVDVGQELELKLGELGLYDAHAGVGKVEGVDVIVADAAKLVGKKVKVRIAAITEGTAWAELLAPVEQALEPLTAEAEAEKPTRARRSPTRKLEAAEADGELAVDDEGDLELETLADDESAEAEVVVEEGDLEPDASGEPTAVVLGPDGLPKKRTRRGTRGGRNRKKKAAPAGGAASAAQNGGEPALKVSEADVVEVDQPAEPQERTELEPAAETEGPVIHMPGRELGETEEGAPPAAPKKRTRRGSRGGKNRRKKPVGGAAAAIAGTDLVEVEPIESGAEAEPEQSVELEPPVVEDEVEHVVEEPSPNGADAEDWGYTPMSEWGIDER